MNPTGSYNIFNSLYLIGSDVHAHSPSGDFNRALRCSSDSDAFACLLLAAQEGCVRAQFLVGLAYHVGRGIAVDYERAAEWYLKAAGHADSRALANLGVMKLLGQGTPPDDIDAYMWLQSAVGLGHTRYRAALEMLERRITGRATAAQPEAINAVSPEDPEFRPCTLPGCSPSRCQVA
jgi:TPR repeat protein